MDKPSPSVDQVLQLLLISHSSLKICMELHSRLILLPSRELLVMGRICQLKRSSLKISRNRTSRKMLILWFKSSRELSKPNNLPINLSTRRTSWSSLTVMKSIQNSWKYLMKGNNYTLKWKLKTLRNLVKILLTKGFWVLSKISLKIRVWAQFRTDFPNS